MRLLVLDGSRVLPALVTRLVPEGVVIESAGSFAEAKRRLSEHPPEALIVNVSPAPLPWQELQELCEHHQPPIPVLYESCVHQNVVEAGLEQPGICGHFLEKPYSISQLRREVEWLVHQAETRCAECAEPLDTGPADDARPH